MMERNERAAAVAELLAGEYPDARCELDYRSPWELLVATMLSAQCTDVRVNRVTPDLFARWPQAAALAAAAQDDVEAVIRPTGMYRRKAASLRAAARIVAEEHGGAPPADIDALVALPGVGRKTAKVVLGEGTMARPHRSRGRGEDSRRARGAPSSRRVDFLLDQDDPAWPASVFNAVAAV